MRPDVARRMALATPAAVPLAMTAIFAALHRSLPSRTAYSTGFAIYWSGCLAVPIAVLGPRRTLRVLSSGRRPTPAEAVSLLLPVMGAVGTELVPSRRLIDARVFATMVGTAALNATAEELLWRGMFLEVFPDDLVRGAFWPLAGFSLWHVAPQIVLPSRHGRAGFVAGAALVGAASTVVSWRTGGLRWVLLPHAVTDACGVGPARFRLGLPTAGPDA